MCRRAGRTCRTLLAKRRESAALPEDFEPGFDGVAEDVERRADLQELLHDLAHLPDDRREALVPFELVGSSQSENAPRHGASSSARLPGSGRRSPGPPTPHPGPRPHGHGDTDRDPDAAVPTP